VYPRSVNTKLDTGLQIGTVAVRSGLTVDTIRFYEKPGPVWLSPIAARAAFAFTTTGTVDRLRFVGRAQALGFSLVEIRELLLLQTAGAEACTHVHNLLNQKLTAVNRRLRI